METPLSRPEGLARAPGDFYWLERNVPCQAACPARTDIPGYLAAISRGDYEQAYRINLADNVFPGVLGRVCARPCEAPCRHGWPGLGESVAICASKRSASDHRVSTEPIRLPPVFPPTGKYIAVVGAGVAGLTAARQLALYGHSVTVFEREGVPGGMMRQGIPAFRLPRAVLEQEIRQIEALGVTLKCSTPIGDDGGPMLDDLRKEFNAIILAAGTIQLHRPDTPGGERAGIEHGLDFLRDVNLRGRKTVGRLVAVIGGGFTAIDCARVALRLGAEKVAVYYRRAVADLVVTPGELDAMAHEGIPLETQVIPRAYEGDRDAVRRIQFLRTRPGEPDASGRRRPVDVPGTEFYVEADRVLLATGQRPDPSWLGIEWKNLLLDADGRWRVDPDGRTAAPGIFLAGDYATGASNLIEAIAHAKSCALAADEYLTGQRRIGMAVTIESGRDVARTRILDELPRQPMPECPLPSRGLETEVELGLAPEPAQQEARRCYLCHYKYEIDMSRCIYCDQCVEAKPRPDCIVKASALQRDEQSRITGWARKSDSVRAEAKPFFYWIHQEDCIRCNACLEVCPVQCINVQKVSLSRGPEMVQDVETRARG